MAELVTEHFDHADHAEHAAKAGNPFLSTVSVTIALLAVLGATIGSFEAVETAETLSSKNEATLIQSKETAAWNYYQAKSVKKNMYEIAAASNPSKSEDYLNEMNRYIKETKEIEENARKLEAEKNAKLDEAHIHEHRHHLLIAGATFINVAIAVSTISIITHGKRWPWYMALILSGIGAVIAVSSYL